MVKIFNYIKAQDKVKFLLYLFSFPIYVLINNLIFNIVIYIVAREYIFNDLYWFGYPCNMVEEAKTILFSSVMLKIGLFFIMILLQKKENLRYLTEVLIIYFLFNFGQIGSMMLCDLLNSLNFELKFDGLWYFSSNFELIFNQFEINTYVICGLWSLFLGIFLWKTKKFFLSYFAKRFFIMPISGLIYGVLKYYYLYHFVWHE